MVNIGNRLVVYILHKGIVAMNMFFSKFIAKFHLKEI